MQQRMKGNQYRGNRKRIEKKICKSWKDTIWNRNKWDERYVKKKKEK